MQEWIEQRKRKLREFLELSPEVNLISNSITCALSRRGRLLPRSDVWTTTSGLRSVRQLSAMIGVRSLRTKVQLLLTTKRLIDQSCDLC